MFTIKEILEATGGRLVSGRLTDSVRGVSIDSRILKAGQLFIAIKGLRYDGHTFVQEAKRKGAAAVLVSDSRYTGVMTRPNGLGQIPVVIVNDTVRALGDLAHYHRSRFNIPVIAITGSCGKTTTKEMASRILSKRFRVLCNPGTQNNLIGVPLALLGLSQEHNLAVLEIGASRSGEIGRLSWIVQPTVAVLTNIGPSHLEFFKNLKGVFTAKSEVVRHLSPDGKLVVNKDDRFLSRLNGGRIGAITFGQNRPCDFRGQIMELTPQGTSFLVNRRHRITLKMLGRHNVYNALASIACARNFGVSFRDIQSALGSFVALPMRMQLLKVRGVKLINDCYNANPVSLSCALDCLANFPGGGKRISVVADMLELGKRAPRLHQDIGRQIAKGKLDGLITVGPLGREMAQAAVSAGMPRTAVYACRNCAQAAKTLQAVASAGDVVLIKGSRAMQMEDVVACFTGSSIR